MARERSQAQWDALSPTYRDRLQRKGISASDYKAGAKLSEARGQSNESEHAKQRKLVDEYGPKNRKVIGTEPYITRDLLRRARVKYGDAWVTNRLEQMKRDYIKSAEGEFPHGGDRKVSQRTPTQSEYSRNASNYPTNAYAPFWWYHGLFG